MDLDQVMSQLRELVKERDWKQFHTPENLAKSISIESAELLELFQWSSDVALDDLRDELADVLTYCLLLANAVDVDPVEIVSDKLERTKAKYPVDKAKGKSVKYDRL